MAPSRDVAGVISFDSARDETDPNTVITVEVFEDEAAVDRQEALPQVGKMELMPDALAAPPEATVFHVSSSSPGSEGFKESGYFGPRSCPKKPAASRREWFLANR